MYNCLNCKMTFYYPLTQKEFHYECDENSYEEYSVCPFCKDSDIEREEICNEQSM